MMGVYASGDRDVLHALFRSGELTCSPLERLMGRPVAVICRCMRTHPIPNLNVWAAFRVAAFRLHPRPKVDPKKPQLQENSDDHSTVPHHYHQN